MASRTTIELIDDITGEAAQHTVEFALNGNAYAIDLSDDNYKALTESFDEFIQFARSVNGDGGEAKRKAAPSRTDREQTAAIRTWAQGNGYQVADRGRIPHEVVEAYNSRELVNA